MPSVQGALGKGSVPFGFSFIRKYISQLNSDTINNLSCSCRTNHLCFSNMVRKQQLELDMEQQTGSKLEKEYVKAVYCHPAYLTYMQSRS